MACKGVDTVLLFSYVLVLGLYGITEIERNGPKIALGFYFLSYFILNIAVDHGE